MADSFNNQMAVNYASRELRDFIARRSQKDFSGEIASPAPPLFGPILDDVDFFRLGDVKRVNFWAAVGYDLEGLLKDQRDPLLAQGFPTIIENETRHVTKLWFDQLHRQWPDRKFVALHFPGGDVNLTVTERETKHYDNSFPVANWIDRFRENKGSWGIMVSHASYDLSSFPDIEKMRQPDSLPFIDEALRKATGSPASASGMELYSKVPASVNPYVIDYLRQNVGYDGMIISDWYGTMGGFSKFRDKVSFDHLIGDAYTKPEHLPASYRGNKAMEEYMLRHHRKKASPDAEDITFLMAVNAGIEYPMPDTFISMSSGEHGFWQTFAKESPAEYAAFNDKLNELIARKYLKLSGEKDITPDKIAATTKELSALPFAHRANLIGEPIDPKNPEFEKYFSALTDDQQMVYDKLHQTINVDNRVIQNDTWRRKGVATMQFRIGVVRYEAFSRGMGTLEELEARWKDPPIYINEDAAPGKESEFQEKAWWQELTKDKDFMKLYHEIGGKDGKGWEKLMASVDVGKAQAPDAAYIGDQDKALIGTSNLPQDGKALLPPTLKGKDAIAKGAPPASLP